MELKSRVQDFQQGYKLINWENVSSTDDVTRALCGDVSYWDDPKFKGLNRRDVEISILREIPRKDWGTAQPYGKPIWQHILTLGKFLTPNRDIMPSTYDICQAMCINYSSGGKMVNTIGSQSIGKTHTTCIIPCWLACLFPDEFLCFIASPLDSIADTGAWGEVVSLMGEIFESNPDLFPEAQVYKSKEIILQNDKKSKGYQNFKFGRFMVRGVTDIGKYRGIKEASINSGFIFLIADELSEFRNFAFVEMYSNIISNESFQAFTSHNWKDDINLAAYVCKPDPRYGGVGAYEELDIDRDQFWDSWGKSVTIRLDGLKSANILAGKTITSYNYFRQSNLDSLLEIYGETDPEFLSQCRAFPSAGDSARTVLSKRKVDKSDWQREFFLPVEPPRKYSFVDPSFGGGDDAIWGYINVGKCRYTDADGNGVVEDLVWMDAPMRKVKFTKGATYVDSKGIDPTYWKKQIENAGIPTALFHEEDEEGNATEIDYEEQLVIQCALWNKEYGVANGDMAYDSSLRPTIVDTMSRLLGSPKDGGARFIDYNTKPHNYYCEAFRQNTEDFCVNHLDELAFLTASLFSTRRIRGGQFMIKAVEELCVTRYETKPNNKKKVEAKADLKIRLSGKSPDRRDCLMGLIAQVYFGGFGKAKSAINSKTEKSKKNYWAEVNRGRGNKYGLTLQEV